MYPLLPWRMMTTLVGLALAMAVYFDDLAGWFGYNVPQAYVVRYLPLCIFAVFSAAFAPTGYWAPWRIAWRRFPCLNNYFPDINGIWVGDTYSNWPTIKHVIEAAKEGGGMTEQQLHDIPEQKDAMAVQIKSSLFRINVCAGLSSTNARSYSITAKPWRQQHTENTHLTYVYKQETPNHVITDEETHLGAAELVFEVGSGAAAEGTYWTRRSWRTGRNTAGRLKLSRCSEKLEAGKSLQQYAQDHKGKQNSQ